MNIIIADDHDLFLEGLSFSLSSAFQGIKIQKARNYDELLNPALTRGKTDLIITDLAMPGKPWTEALEILKKTLPKTPIIVISAVYDRATVTTAIDLGASGFIPKTASGKIILSAIQLVLAGGTYLPTELLQSKEDLSGREKEELAWKGKLTKRQREVMHLMALGKSNKVIAQELKLTEGTVKLHVTAILKALNVSNRTGAVLKATSMAKETPDKFSDSF
jgi:DNA-binding NarL/FixJ family response regulator